MKLKAKNTRKLQKLGKTSLAVTLPKEMTAALRTESLRTSTLSKSRSVQTKASGNRVSSCRALRRGSRTMSHFPSKAGSGSGISTSARVIPNSRR